MNRKLNNIGVTLIELLAVMIIIGIIALIAVPMYTNDIEQAEEGVCHTNMFELERMYEMNLELKSNTHTDQKFTSYLREYGSEPCPVEGIITYMGDEVRCSVHGSHHEEHTDEDSEGDDDDSGSEVPYL